MTFACVSVCCRYNKYIQIEHTSRMMAQPLSVDTWYCEVNKGWPQSCYCRAESHCSLCMTYIALHQVFYITITIIIYLMTSVSQCCWIAYNVFRQANSFYSLLRSSVILFIFCCFRLTRWVKIFIFFLNCSVFWTISGDNGWSREM